MNRETADARKERIREYQRKYRSDPVNKARKAAIEKIRRAKPENIRAEKERSRKARYGLPDGAYEKMFIEHDGKCAICRGTNVHGRDLSVDHNHKTKTIRGLLCNRCNFGIGLFKDRPELLIKASNYLEQRN